jgi:MFS family permease
MRRGAINSTVPVLQAEASPKATRGRFVCFQLSLLNLGILLAYWVGYGFTSVTGSKAWRVPIALQAVFIICIMILLFVVPESPRWLAAHGRGEESLAVLGKLQGKSVTHSDVLQQHQDIQEAVALEKSVGSGTWRDLLHEDEIKSRRRLLIACGIQAMQQAGGINGLIYFAGYVFFALQNSLSNSPQKPPLRRWTRLTRHVPCLWLPLHLVLCRVIHPLVPHRHAR